MKNQDRNREKQLERLFEKSRELLPGLEPDPGLPAHIRALAAARDSRREPRRGWGWVSLAGATLALSIMTGGYVGYQVWKLSQNAATEQVGDTDAVASALSQSGFADELALNNEVQK